MNRIANTARWQELAAHCEQNPASTALNRALLNSGDSRRFGTRVSDDEERVLLGFGELMAQTTPQRNLDTSKVPLGSKRAAQAVAEAWQRNITTARWGGEDVSASNAVLSINVDGDEVDVEAWVRDETVEQDLLGAQRQLSKSLAKRGLRLRSLTTRIAKYEETQPPPTVQQREDVKVGSSKTLRRSFIKVVA